MSELTEKQKEWWENYQEIGDGYQAALKSDYSESTAKHWKRDILQSEAVQDRVKNDLALSVFGGRSQILLLLDEAVSDLRGIVKNKDNSAQVRLNADRTIIEQANELSKVLGFDSEKSTEKLERLVNATEQLAEQHS